MALTRTFKETIATRARRDPRFREALLTEAVNAYLGGDAAEGKAILRDLVNSTIGFEGLAAEIRTPSKSLHRMLSPRGNPRTDNFFRIIGALQRTNRVKLRVIAATGRLERDPRFLERIERARAGIRAGRGVHREDALK